MRLRLRMHRAICIRFGSVHQPPGGPDPLICASTSTSLWCDRLILSGRLIPPPPSSDTYVCILTHHTSQIRFARQYLCTYRSSQTPVLVMVQPTWRSSMSNTGRTSTPSMWRLQRSQHTRLGGTAVGAPPRRRCQRRRLPQGSKK
ncbi:hypothetical protein GY45DRAFT_940507 [Cubamyces sp. BRFM 1775]|nr:hypothetical protein GY45DRAFT_940507 [Cubamyces sp. BRFM 1775]